MFHRIPNELWLISFNCVCSRSGVIEKMEALELENQEKMEVEESGRSGVRQGRSEHRRFHREVGHWILVFLIQQCASSHYTKTWEWGGKHPVSSLQDRLVLLFSSISFFPFHLTVLFPPSPYLSPVFVLFVGQRSPVCGIHFQSPFCVGNPPGDIASLSQLILCGCFNTVNYLYILRRMTTSPFPWTIFSVSANLCAFYTDAFKQYIQM